MIDPYTHTHHAMPGFNHDFNHAFNRASKALAKNQGAMEGPLKVAGVESMGLGSESMKDEKSAWCAGKITMLSMGKSTTSMAIFNWKILETWNFQHIFPEIPSGKLSHNYGKSPCYQWVNPL